MGGAVGDINNIKLNSAIPMAADDTVAVAAGAASYTLTRSSLFANDLNFEGDALQLRAVGDAVGGTVSQNGGGDFVFTPTAGNLGIISFAYSTDSACGIMRYLLLKLHP